MGTWEYIEQKRSTAITCTVHTYVHMYIHDMYAYDDNYHFESKVRCTGLMITHPPDPMIAAACVPVFSASLLTICAPECVQESGVECALYVVTAV